MVEPIPKRVTIQTENGKFTSPCKRVPGTDEFTCNTPEGEEMRFKVDRKTSQITIITGSETIQGKPLPNLAEVTGTTPKGENFGINVIDQSIFPGKYTADDLIYIRQRQTPLYDIWKCVCDESNYQEVCGIVGASFCVKMGSDLVNFMNELKG